MWRAFYANLDFAWLPSATTLFFVSVFCIALFKLFVLNGKSDFERVAALPLNDEKENGS